MGAGRPTLYRPEYCEKIIDMFKQGMSKCEIALELDICMETFATWGREHPEFLAAVKKGVSFSQGNWESKGRKNLENKDFNATLWIMNMKNRFRKKWGDKTIIKQTTTHKLDAKDVEELEEIKKAYKRDL